MSAVIVAGRAWLIAGVLGVLTVMAALALFRTPQVTLPRTSANHSSSTAKVELAPAGDSLLNEEVALRDPTPLFLPTRWNAVEDALATSAMREPGGAFQSYPPSLTFPRAELQLELAPGAGIPSRVSDSFAIERPDRPFTGLGQTDRKLVPLPVRAAYIEVTASESGRVVFQQPLLEDRPPAEGTWEPLEILIAVDSAGVVRPPVLTESSQVPTVDAYFQDYLVKKLRIGERLAPGFYRINIGP